jgi:CheY-like chemotaxis protein
MKKTVNCIMLVDDNKVDNFFHQRVIRKYSDAITIITKESGQEALDYLTALQANPLPDIIFLDINMPGMNGWEFIEHYKKLDHEIYHSIIIVMLTTSGNPDEEQFAITNKMISELRTKPLTVEILQQIIEELSLSKPDNEG